MKILIFFIPILLFLGCSEQPKEDFLNKKETPKYNVETFAVVWETVSMQKEKIIKHLPAQQQQLQKLWDEGTAENVYLKTDEKFGENDTFPNIMFFLKAKNREAAEELLNEMEFVKNKLAIYNLYPVGVLWLTRNDKTLEKIQQSKKTFAVIWSSTSNDKLSDDDIRLQSEGFTKLWDEGYIENAYFDIVGASTGKKDRPTVVNFVNAQSTDEVHKILSELHFVKNERSTYMLFDVGVLWLGVNKK